MGLAQQHLTNLRSSKELTRTARGLLALSCGEGLVVMPKPKTHFAQVPLETVRKIVEAQEHARTSAQDLEAKNKKLKGNIGREGW
jgi:hypothetical protein